MFELRKIKSLNVPGAWGGGGGRIENKKGEPLQSGPQPQKSVIFSRSVFSLNQLLQNSKKTANIFLTFRNHVKIFLSRNTMHNA